MVATSQLALRHGVRQIAGRQSMLSWPTVQAAALSPWIWISVVLGLATFILYGYLLSRAEMTFVAPTINGVFYLIIFAAATFWLKEAVTPSRAAGAGLLLIAMWLLSRGVR
jgi:drug/metabolite transporter (DMT)-like permease